jgi:hypothetical protein
MTCRRPVGADTPSPTWHQQRVPGPHGFAVRFSIIRLPALDRSQAEARPAILSRANAAASTASRPNVRDDGQRPSEWNGMAEDIEVIWVKREPKYFCKGNWTGQITLICLNKLACTRTAKNELFLSCLRCIHRSLATYMIPRG